MRKLSNDPSVFIVFAVAALMALLLAFAA